MKKNKGFTLIELLAVIVILGILLSMSIVYVVGIRDKQSDQNRKNYVSSIFTGIRQYIADYPEMLDYLGNDATHASECKRPAHMSGGVVISKYDISDDHKCVLDVYPGALGEKKYTGKSYLELDYDNYPEFIYEGSKTTSFRSARIEMLSLIHI